MKVIDMLLKQKEKLGEDDFEAYVELICLEMAKSLNDCDWSLFFDLKDFLESELDNDLTYS